MTLPLIYILNNCSEKDKRWIIDSVKNHNKDKKRVKEVIRFVKEHNGMAYTEAKMREFQQKALALLAQYPDSQYKTALTIMVNYVIDRKI